MKRIVNKFLQNESGAITVDWVVLTAAILGVLFGALTTFKTGTMQHAELTSSTIEERNIPTY